MKIIKTPEEFLAALERAAHPGQSEYLAMYATWLGGIVKHAPWMVIAVDDHMVHRGDGVFDVAKCVDGHIYLLAEHLDRLRRNAEALRITPPPAFDRVEEIIIETVRAGGERDALVRIFLSRGPGDFTLNVEGTFGGQLAVVVTTLPKVPPERRRSGVKAIIAATPAKPSWLAGVKSLDYLQNLFLKSEADAAGAEIALALDGQGSLTEGPVMSIGLVTHDKELLFPRPEGILPGTTLARLMDLGQELFASGLLVSIGRADIDRRLLSQASEIFACGTTIDVLSIVELDGRKVGTGRPGPAAERLNALLTEEILHSPTRRTPVFEPA
jgi:branched-subunit amino acid aminotransferase/4-amino-4-deoxychorismate lyase